MLAQCIEIANRDYQGVATGYSNFKDQYGERWLLLRMEAKGWTYILGWVTAAPVGEPDEFELENFPARKWGKV